MLSNYFKVALRSLLKNKTHSIVNILGLTVGFASCVFIAIFIRHELSYDDFHEHGDRIYRVTHDERGLIEGGRYMPTTGPPVGPSLMREFPEIESAVRFRFTHRNVMEAGGNQFYEEEVVYADSTLFEVFSLPLLLGNPETALSAPNTVVLTEQTAQKYFGDRNPLGEEMRMDGQSLAVTGVFAPIPENSHINFDFVVSFSTFTVPRGYPVTLDDWGWISFYNYVLLDERADPKQVEAQLPAFIARHFEPDQARRFVWRLQPLHDIYMGEVLSVDMPSGNMARVYGLGAVGALILLLACFNFMNLSMARSVDRAKESGIRKALGALRSNLVQQFLGEPILISLLALAMATAVVWLAGPLLIRLLDLSFAINFSAVWALVPVFLGIAIVSGLLAGSYPALVLSAFSPVSVLRGRFGGSTSGITLRKTLVVLQFSITIALIAGTLIVSRQMSFISERDLGFDEESVVILHIPRQDSDERYPLIKARLERSPEIVSVSASGGLLDGNQGSVPVYMEGTVEGDGFPVNIYGVRFDFFETIGVDLKEGRLFQEEIASDTTRAIVLNQSAVDFLGLQDPIGEPLRIFDLVDGEVVGVVEDFHFASLHEAVQPLAIFYSPLVENVYVRVRPGDWGTTLAELERTWSAVVPDLPFHFTLLDESIDQLYAADRRFSRLISAFSILTLVVACLGLYGLIASLTAQRMREIAIRKVLGASIPSILTLLSRQLLLLIATANILAWPVAYLFSNRWLQDFAYRVDLDGWSFLAAGLTALVVAAITLSFQTVRAATSEPVPVLRQE